MNVIIGKCLINSNKCCDLKYYTQECECESPFPLYYHPLILLLTVLRSNLLSVFSLNTSLQEENAYIEFTNSLRASTTVRYYKVGKINLFNKKWGLLLIHLKSLFNTPF